MARKSKPTDFDERLEQAIHDHFKYYMDEFDKALPKGGDLLEYLWGRNLAIDRDLLGAYLNFRAAKANNNVQRWVAFFAGMSVAAAIISVMLKLF